MTCPYCGVKFSLDGVNAYHTSVRFRGFPFGSAPDGESDDKQFTISAHRCPECRKQVMWLNELGPDGHGDLEVASTSLLYPRWPEKVLPDAIPREYAQEYREAYQTLEISPKASAALSRRTLQRLIRGQENINERTLFAEIKKLLDLNRLPTYLAQDVDSLRNVGNFAAHPIEDRATGEIIDVEAGEAEWTLQVLEGLLNFYFVDLQKSKERRTALNEKLRRAGKGDMKDT